MTIPDGYTEQQVLDIILDISEKFKNKYSFNEWAPDDIKQEAYFICVSALDRFDASKGKLANFLSKNLANRLRTFKRDKLVRHIPAEQLEETYEVDVQPCLLHLNDFHDLVDSKLNAHDREDYLKLKDGVKLPRVRLAKLKNKIAQILDDVQVDDLGESNE